MMLIFKMTVEILQEVKFEGFPKGVKTEIGIQGS